MLQGERVAVRSILYKVIKTLINALSCWYDGNNVSQEKNRMLSQNLLGSEV